jgi:hypothetical protein
MATFSKSKLSGSTDGKGVLVVASATPGTTIHTAGAVTGDDNFDEIWLWAMNTDTTARKLTLEIGGTTVGFLDEVTIGPEEGFVLVCPGLILQNAAVLAAFASVASVVNLHGFVNKIRA